MPTYTYTAKTEAGKTETGNAFANSTHELAEDLKGQGLVLIKAVDENLKKKPLSFSFSKKVSITDKLLLARNLEVMVATGLPLVKSFSLLANQASNKTLKDALSSIQEQISKGESLANALSKFPDIFSEIFRNMIAVGEASGTLEDILKVLALQLEKDHRLRSKVKRAFIYPCILLSVMLIVGLVVMTVFVPGLKSLFTGMGVDLPIYTVIMIGTGEFMLKYWYFMLIIFVLSVFALIKFLKTSSGKKALDTILIQAPFISKLVMKTNSASLIRSLSSLISAGVPLVEALQITSRTLSNGYFEKAVVLAGEKIKKGEGLSQSLLASKKLFPLGCIETIQVGEETGETSDILKKLAEFYEEEVMEIADNISTLIEPILIVLLGASVGIFAVAVLSPLYSVLGQIH